MLRLSLMLILNTQHAFLDVGKYVVWIEWNITEYNKFSQAATLIDKTDYRVKLHPLPVLLNVITDPFNYSTALSFYTTKGINDKRLLLKRKWRNKCLESINRSQRNNTCSLILEARCLTRDVITCKKYCFKIIQNIIAFYGPHHIVSVPEYKVQ